MKPQQNGITLLGLGPGQTSQLTLEAWDVLSNAEELVVRTSQHPAIAGLPKSLQITSFDNLYESSRDFQEVYDSIIHRVLEMGRKKAGIIYAVPGHPFVAEATCPEIHKLAKLEGIPVRVVEGISFLEPTFTSLELDPFPLMVLVDALELGLRQMPAFPPDEPAIIAQIYSRAVASDVKLTLMSVYPDEYMVKLVHAAGTDAQMVEELPLYEIDRSPHLGLLSSLYLPPMRTGTTFESFQEVIARLRAPDGCPWDQEQTHMSLRPHLLEEAHEALEAMDAEDPAALVEELGDLLLQIVLHAQIASELGEFQMTDILEGIYTKIIRRHPHVFAKTHIEGVDGVLKNWEKLKEEEREKKVETENKGILDGAPRSLPALSLAQEYQDRAARVGFDWPDITPVLEKVQEELAEVQAATNSSELEEELGDLLFAVVNLVRWHKVDAESALRGTNAKFFRRFKYVEESAHKQGRRLSEMSLKEMDTFWDEAKRSEKGN